MNLTNDQKTALILLANSGKIEEAIEQCIALCGDALALSLLERGGHATLQLNPAPYAIPRIRFIAPEETQIVKAAKIGAAVIYRN